MMIQVAFICKFPAANVALVSWAFSAMNSSHMSTQVTLVRKLTAANIALVTTAISAMSSSHM